MKTQIVTIFCLLASVLSTNLFAVSDAAAHGDHVHKPVGYSNHEKDDESVDAPILSSRAGYKHPEIETKEDCDSLHQNPHYHTRERHAARHEHTWREHIGECWHSIYYIPPDRFAPPVEEFILPLEDLDPPDDSELPEDSDQTRPRTVEDCEAHELLVRGECFYPSNSAECNEHFLGRFFHEGECLHHCQNVGLDIGREGDRGYCIEPCEEGSRYGYSDECVVVPADPVSGSVSIKTPTPSISVREEPKTLPILDNAQASSSSVPAGTPLVRTPGVIQSPVEPVGNAVSELGIQSGSYASVDAQQIPSAESRLPEYAAPAALLGALAFSGFYPDYELGSSFNYSGENANINWEAGMRGDFHHGSFRSYVSAIQSDNGFAIHSGTAYRSDSFLASYTTVEAKDYMNYAVQLSAPWSRNRWSISPNLSSQFHYDRNENHSNSSSEAGLDLEYRF